MNKDNEILSVIKFLTEEIEDEIRNNEAYEKAKVEAMTKAEELNKNKPPHRCEQYWFYHMPKELHALRKSVINANAKKIRQLCLKLYRVSEDRDE